jgi:AraC-like DNA-binding protein
LTIAEYRELPPRPDLAEIVNCVWTFDGDDVLADQPVAPDGRCELIVHCAEPYHEYLPNSDVAVRQAPILFAGQVTRPLILRAGGSVSVVAVRFNPAGAWPFIGSSLAAFTNRRVDLTSVFGEEAQKVLMRIRSAPKVQRLHITQEFVAHRVMAARRMRDPLVERCVSLVYENSLESIDSARTEAGLSMRQLQRRFATVVGVPPRTLAAIVRFRRVFEALQRSDARSWTEAAHAAGYYDSRFPPIYGCVPVIVPVL